jgi:SAM-dependent methyltransferase
MYELEWVKLLLGDSFHPGGLALTERLGRCMGLNSNAAVLDVACGRGTSAVHLARTFGCHVVGTDLSVASIEAARELGQREGLAHRVDFRVANAEHVPLEGEAIDAVLCECAFCTFIDKDAVALEFFRVLKPGGVIGISDITCDAPLPDELRSLAAWIACVADARPVGGYVSCLAGAGLIDSHVEPYDDVLRSFVADVRTRLLGAELVLKLRSADLPGVDLDQAAAMGRTAAAAVDSGVLGYALITARKSHGTMA